MGVQGLCAYVIQTIKDAKQRGVVIGHDHRHNSARWARLAAAAFIDKGVKVFFYEDLVHTPMYVENIDRYGGPLHILG